MSRDSEPPQPPENDDTRAAVTLGLQLRIAGENVSFQVTIPAGPASSGDLLPFMRALVQVANQISGEQANNAGRQISCQAGCGICCRQSVPIAEFEAERLLQVIEQMPEPRRTEVKDRFRETEQRLRDAGQWYDRQTLQTLRPEQLVERTKEYFKLMIPCPFLEDESCSIHPERPLKCREYLVTSPAENCADPENLPIDVIPPPLNVYRTTLFLDQDPDQPELRWLPLTSLFDWANHHVPSPPTRTGPELLEEFMTNLTRPTSAASPPC